MKNGVKIPANQSLIRGLSLIDILSDYPNGCSLAKLAELSQLNKSTTHRMLQALQFCGYVKPANNAGSYRLSTKCMAIGQKILSSINILDIATPILEKLNQTVGETVNFSTREDNHAIMLYKLNPISSMMQTRSYVGQQLKLYCSAMGKIFMAYDQPNYVAQYWKTQTAEIQQLTDYTIITQEKMVIELNQIKQQGYAVDNEENEIGVTCLAYPIFDEKNNVKYSLSVSLSTAKLAQWNLMELHHHIKNAAQEISQELGHTAN